QAGSQAKLFFTGGDGQLLADHFHSKGDYVPNLVLNGLSLIGEKIANE
ncbi:type III pantothenate kinase, partial [bacterium]|nr:type III pantothenate kinase [bacterium]